MRNTGILLFLAGLYIVINSGSFRDLVFGKAEIGFLTPKKSTSKVTAETKNEDALPSSIAERFGAGNAS